MKTRTPKKKKPLAKTRQDSTKNKSPKADINSKTVELFDCPNFWLKKYNATKIKRFIYKTSRSYFLWMRIDSDYINEKFQTQEEAEIQLQTILSRHDIKPELKLVSSHGLLLPQEPIKIDSTVILRAANCSFTATDISHHLQEHYFDLTNKNLTPDQLILLNIAIRLTNKNTLPKIWLNGVMSNEELQRSFRDMDYKTFLSLISK